MRGSKQANYRINHTIRLSRTSEVEVKVNYVQNILLPHTHRRILHEVLNDQIFYQSKIRALIQP